MFESCRAHHLSAFISGEWSSIDNRELSIDSHTRIIVRSSSYVKGHGLLH